MLRWLHGKQQQLPDVERKLGVHNGQSVEQDEISVTRRQFLAVFKLSKYRINISSRANNQSKLFIKQCKVGQKFSDIHEIQETNRTLTEDNAIFCKRKWHHCYHDGRSKRRRENFKPALQIFLSFFLYLLHFLLAKPINRDNQIVQFSFFTQFSYLRKIACIFL